MTNNAQSLDEPRSQTRIQSVSRAVTLLAGVADTPEGVTAKALADRFGLSLPTTYHLLTTLWAEGMLVKDEHRVFRLGPRVGVIADAYQRTDAVPQSYRRALHEVVKKTGETGYLGVWRGNVVKVLETAEGAHAVRVVGLDAGYSEDMHARASGKLLLAFADDELRASLVNDLRLRKLTPHTITKKSHLIAELAEIRATGLSFDREEFQLGVECVSAPIRHDGRVVACITVSVPVQRFSATRDEVIAALVETTEAVGADD